VAKFRYYNVVVLFTYWFTRPRLREIETGEIVKKGARSKKGSSNILQIFNDKLHFYFLRY